MSRFWVDRIPRFLWRWGVFEFDRAWRVCLGPIELVWVKKQ